MKHILQNLQKLWDLFISRVLNLPLLFLQASDLSPGMLVACLASTQLQLLTHEDTCTLLSIYQH